MSNHCNQCHSILDDYEIGVCKPCEYGGMYEYEGAYYYRTAIEEGFTEEEIESCECMDASELFELLVERGTINEVE